MTKPSLEPVYPNLDDHGYDQATRKIADGMIDAERAILMQRKAELEAELTVA